MSDSIKYELNEYGILTKYIVRLRISRNMLTAATL